MDIASQDDKQRTALHWLIYCKSFCSLEFVLAHEQDLELKDKFGHTALHRAMFQVDVDKSVSVIKTLIVRGADKNALTDDGKSCN